MSKLKGFLSDFPNQNGGVVTGLVLILLTGAVVIFRLAVGKPFPDGYEAWLIFLGSLAGVSTIGMIGKRATDIGYAAAKKSTPVTAEAGSTVKVDSAAGSTGTFPVQVSAAESSVPLTHRESERGEP